jgi:8-oxo-dGTP pyrophosphatase MutT (NUDIX family)
MAHQWELIDTEIVWQDPWGTVYRKRYRLGNGRPDQQHVTVQKPEFALMVALDDAQNILLVRQYRHGTDQNYWALPGGFIDRGEDPLAAAKRELLEETGYSAKRMTLLGSLHPVPAFLNTVGHIVLCEQLQEVPGVVLDEEIEGVDSLPLSKAIEKNFAGEINEMQAVTSILMANEFLRRRAA